MTATITTENDLFSPNNFLLVTLVHGVPAKLSFEPSLPQKALKKQLNSHQATRQEHGLPKGEFKT